MVGSSSLTDLMSMAKPDEELKRKIVPFLPRLPDLCLQCAHYTSGCSAGQSEGLS